MKILLAFLILCCAREATAQNVNLSWQPSASTNVVAYIIYLSTNGAPAASSETINTGNTNCFLTLKKLPAGQYWFAATAINCYGSESPFSNVLVWEIPLPASNLRL